MNSKSLVFLRYLTIVFDNIKDAVLLISIEEGGDLRLLLANQAFHDMTGYAPDCIGKKLPEFISPQCLNLATNHHKKVTKLKKPIRYTTWSEVPSGKHAYEIKVIPVLNTVDEVVQLVIIARDITKLAQLRQQVRSLRASLRQD